MPQFHESIVGAKFLNGTMPRIADGIEELVAQLERLNDNLEALADILKQHPDTLQDD